MPATSIRELGIPVRSVNRANLYPGYDADGAPRILATMSQQADSFFLLVIDPRDGSFRQLSVNDPTANYTTAVFMSRTGRLYVGAAYAGRLYCYDPECEELLDLGLINPGKATYPCRIDEDSRGNIWISSYGAADLTRFDPETGGFDRYGRMDDVDMYAYCYVNTDDSVACLIKQTRPHVAVLDPVTRERRIVGPVVAKGEGTVELYRAVDGRLYIESSEGNFRIDESEAVPIGATVPPAETHPSVLPDGTAFRYTDAAEHVHRNLEITYPDGSSRTFFLDYDAAGTDIFCLHGGPDGCVYGSSVLPEHFFRYDPESGGMIDFGVCSEAVGEAYSMANLDGKIYISSYPGARVSEYDPLRPYRYGHDPESNPRELGRIDDISYRPHSTLAGPGGKVWLASLPDYGMWGGPLSCYDPASGEKKAFRRICGDGSCCTLAWLAEQELIVVGTTIQGGSGTLPKIDRAVLFLFDYENEMKTWEGTPDERVSAFTSLVALGEGRVVGTLRSEKGEFVFAFDGVERVFTAMVAAPEGGLVENGLRPGPDGALYGLTRTLIFRLDPDSLRSHIIVRFDRPLTAHASAGPILDGELYYSAGHKLMAARIV